MVRVRHRGSRLLRRPRGGAEADQDGPHGYAKRDLLRVAVSEDEVEGFDETLAAVREREAAAGPPATGSIHELSSDEARAAFPLLADVERAFRYDDAARVDGDVEGALRRAGEAHGLETRNASAERLVVDGGAIEAVVVDGERIDTDRVVVAGGAWSAAFGDQFGNRDPNRTPARPNRPPRRRRQYDRMADREPVSRPLPRLVGRWPCGGRRDP